MGTTPTRLTRARQHVTKMASCSSWSTHATTTTILKHMYAWLGGAEPFQQRRRASDMVTGGCAKAVFKEREEGISLQTI